MRLAHVFSVVWIYSVAASSTPIDRAEVVRRHVVRLHGIGIGPSGPSLASPLTLTVGNGVIGFNADMTGLQSLNTTYTTFPLTTLSDWGWHSFPLPDPSPFDTFEYTHFNVSSGSSVPYPLDSSGSNMWLRENPHRLDLIQVGLRRHDALLTPLSPADVHNGLNASQVLDPYTGEMVSSFMLWNRTMRVRTTGSMEVDLLSWEIDSLDTESVIRVAFPYGSGDFSGGGHDWSKDSAHYTRVVQLGSDFALLQREIDMDAYMVLCRWNGRLSFLRDGRNSFHLALTNGIQVVELSCLLSPPGAQYPVDPTAQWLQDKRTATTTLLELNAPLPLYTTVAADAARGWRQFWESGAFVDLAGATSDPRAFELERRVILSQFLTRSQSAGSTPPQETGYTLNSWYGKHHHEMRWWHQAHFALWQRPELLQRSDGWFRAMLPNATAYAHFQGYSGARWPKMVGPATTVLSNPDAHNAYVAPAVGKEQHRSQWYANSTRPLLYWTGPSSTGPMLVWQQPHIIWMTELQRLHASTAEAARIIASMSDVVEATADFMASYPMSPAAGSGGNMSELWLGPPTDGGEEGNPIVMTWNPTFELTYWRLGLKIASEWRERAGLPPKPAWERVLARLATPTVLPGKDKGTRAYAINGNCYGFPTSETIPGKHRCSGAYQSHPLVLGALGMINGMGVSPPIDANIMNTTLALSIQGWDWKDTWGWDYPLWAFSMMRLGWASDTVVDMLLQNETKNTYFANGHDYEEPYLPCYLPGNGGLLSAVAMMAGGYVGSDAEVFEVGFPVSWNAKTEGFKAYP